MSSVHTLRFAVKFSGFIILRFVRPAETLKHCRPFRFCMFAAS